MYKRQGFDLVADLQVLAGVVHALGADVARQHVAFDAFAQVNRGALGIHFLDHAFQLGTLRIGRHELAERILFHLLDAQADALAFRVNGQHHGFQRVALLVVCLLYTSRCV